MSVKVVKYICQSLLLCDPKRRLWSLILMSSYVNKIDYSYYLILQLLKALIRLTLESIIESKKNGGLPSTFAARFAAGCRQAWVDWQARSHCLHYAWRDVCRLLGSWFTKCKSARPDRTAAGRKPKPWFRRCQSKSLQPGWKRGERQLPWGSTSVGPATHK